MFKQIFSVRYPRVQPFPGIVQLNWSLTGAFCEGEGEVERKEWVVAENTQKKKRKAAEEVEENTDRGHREKVFWGNVCGGERKPTAADLSWAQSLQPVCPRQLNYAVHCDQKNRNRRDDRGQAAELKAALERRKVRFKDSTHTTQVLAVLLCCH